MFKSVENAVEFIITVIAMSPIVLYFLYMFYHMHLMGV